MKFPNFYYDTFRIIKTNKGFQIWCSGPCCERSNNLVGEWNRLPDLEERLAAMDSHLLEAHKDQTQVFYRDGLQKAVEAYLKAELAVGAAIIAADKVDVPRNEIQRLTAKVWDRTTVRKKFFTEPKEKE